MDILEIDNTFEAGGTNLDFWEIQSPWSYSADTQIAFMHQLQRAGILPIIPGEGRDVLGLPDEMGPLNALSLHLNFRLPFPIENSGEFEATHDMAVHDVVDALTFAYVSPERLVSRKTLNAWNITETRVDDTEKNIDDPDRPNGTHYRLETRPFEVTDQETPALIHDSQRLVAGFIAHVITGTDQTAAFNSLPQVEQDRARAAAIAFKEFRKELELLRVKHGGILRNFMDYLTTNARTASAADLVRDLSVVDDFRKLVTKYAGEIGRAIGLDDIPAPGRNQSAQ